MSKDSKKRFDHLFLRADEATVWPTKPPYFLVKNYLIDGELRAWNGPMTKVFSPIHIQGSDEPICIGEVPAMTGEDAVKCVEAASKAYDCGLGVWPQMHVKDRIAVIENFTKKLAEKKDEIVKLLMWEICKNEEDSKKEVDRTLVYIKDTIQALKDIENQASTFQESGGVSAHIRRAPFGRVLCCGPFNYPFNETYATLIPALIMGNTVVMKLPKFGPLCHYPTYELFKECFPPGVVNIVSGSGRATMPSIMKTGKIDVLAFIGTNTAATDLQKAHPKPHRLRAVLGLDAKNPAIVLPSADVDVAAKEVILGSLSYNGQRCTAIKITFVHESMVDRFFPKLIEGVEKMKMGLPWQTGVNITPVAEAHKPDYVQDVIDDALKKGAKVLNPSGNKIDRSFVSPTILYPVTKEMKVFREEQFGPVIPVCTYKDVKEVYEYLAESQYGQQAAVFGTDTIDVARMTDVLVNQVSRVNLNSQCQRGPDCFPFTGRKDSAYGTLSVVDALRAFSIRSLIAFKSTTKNQEIVNDVLRGNHSHFLRLDYLF
uniref:Succinate-semialdehyde dehydrogenase, mitochondrial n=1 Tax=Chromera velia CCMP2878 TaxID=1169474 RepID=A0A0G4IAY0_9ALVE|mmetsp:Transcript_15045/g.30459  ORF Transcript_15045/g.30459 Transcript_15045/m.30459 type:complete len:542 (-) Transcript_15045:1583-3208(-)|eukprot:Cvel_2151.t1-p1 / transcript=Cvel_2151.t1 / gene=Cvel_2151 / organism=Chromera_velia_CCMP2878 / gene_product=NADP-dependent glyceraldehyde-3-phosphate, putative / transcript_product=NADP-dependent glyceraldehyde-3-phosphate, putative / location=Cvel_scaffold83:105345-109622(+) / protein_length=541 / sequence_SO=supercontig / SO=protein_coding / is_pseudo=false